MVENENNMSAAVIAGQEAAEVEKRVMLLEVDGVEIPLAANGTTVQVLAQALAESDSRRPAPARRTTSLELSEVGSFIDYVNRYKNADRSTIYADLQSKSVVCVFDDHPKGPAPGAEAGWRQHRVTYKCPLALEWVRWTKLAGTKLSQVAFADVIDNHMHDLTSGEGFPSPTELLKMAQSLQITIGHRFKRSFDKVSGTGVLINETEHTAESTKIPRGFMLALRVFEGGEMRAVEARLQFSMSDGNVPVFSFELYRREEHEREAFDDVRKAIAERTLLPLFAGKP